MCAMHWPSFPSHLTMEIWDKQLSFFRLRAAVKWTALTKKYLCLDFFARKLKNRRSVKNGSGCTIFVKKRPRHGDYYTLFPELVRDPDKFFQYFRMSYEKFRALLDLIEDDLKKEDTTFRRSISPEERLAVCLRWVYTNIYWPKFLVTETACEVYIGWGI